MSRASRPGIGLETQFAFSANCSDASPLGVDCSTEPYTVHASSHGPGFPRLNFGILAFPHSRSYITARWLYRRNLRPRPRHCWSRLSSARIVTQPT